MRGKDAGELCLIDVTDEHILVLNVAMYSRTSNGLVAGEMMAHVRNALIVKHLRMNGQKLRPTNEQV